MERQASNSFSLILCTTLQLINDAFRVFHSYSSEQCEMISLSSYFLSCVMSSLSGKVYPDTSNGIPSYCSTEVTTFLRRPSGLSYFLHNKTAVGVFLCCCIVTQLHGPHIPYGSHEVAWPWDQQNESLIFFVFCLWHKPVRL